MAEFISLVFIIWVVWVFLKAITQSHNSRSSWDDDKKSEPITYFNRALDCEPLKGKELLEKVKELGDISKAELVQLCGYYSTTKRGVIRLNYLAFYEALLEAKGIGLNELSSSQRSKELEILNYIATVNDDCEIEIAKQYTELIDLKPGDQLDIKMGRKGFRLILIDPEGKENNLWNILDPENK